MTDIEFSDWYFLFLTPTFTYNDHNEKNDLGPSDSPSPSNLATTSPNKLTLTALKSTSKEVAESLSEKLSVPASEFSIISIEEYQVLCSGSIFYFYKVKLRVHYSLYERREIKPYSAALTFKEQMYTFLVQLSESKFVSTKVWNFSP